MEVDVLLLAAGFGSRLHPLTRQIPKALLPIYGVATLDHQLEQCRFARRIVVNGHHLANLLQAHLDTHPHQTRLAFSHEPEILGTGGAIGHAGHLLTTDPFLVHNADALFRLPFAEALAFHRQGRYLATMVLTRSSFWPNVLVEGDRVVAIRRGERLAHAFTFTGCHVISREILAQMPTDRFHDIRDTYDELIARKRLGGFVWPRDEEGRLLDIGTPAAYLEAHRLCAEGDAHSYGLLDDLAGANRIHPFPELHRAESFGFVDPAATIGRDCRIAESVILAGAHVRPHTRLWRTIVGPGAEVAGVLENVLVTTLGSRSIP